ncbi:hypothetical protein ACFQL0_08040 [Haloplanus litoreus]
MTAAFRGDGGPLAALPSSRAEGMAALFGLAATEGSRLATR